MKRKLVCRTALVMLVALTWLSASTIARSSNQKPINKQPEFSLLANGQSTPGIDVVLKKKFGGSAAGSIGTAKGSSFTFENVPSENDNLTLAAKTAVEQKGLKATNEPASDVPAQKVRLIVSFYSIGTGINSQARNRFTEYISRYEKAKAVKLAKEEVHWGREGEVDYCLQLKEIRPKERQKFILKIRSLLKNARYVRIEENAPCKNMR